MQEVYNLLKESRNYLLFSLIIIIVGAGLGYSYSHVFATQVNQMIKEIEEIAKHVQEQDSALYTAWFIFQNNTKVALMMVTVGTLLFFVPFFTLFFNGLAIGYVLKQTALREGIPALDIFLYYLMPHGILELPAILVAGGMGMFLGIRLIRWLFGKGQFFFHLLGNKERSDVRTFWAEQGKPVFLKRIQAVSTLLIILIVTLFVAAFIESYITPVVITHFIKGV